MNRPMVKIGSMYVRQGFAQPVAVIPEDNNVCYFGSSGLLAHDLMRRARCVLGFRGGSRNPNGQLNGSALQHAVRVIAGSHQGDFNVDEHIVAQHAVHIANETEYWGMSDLHNDVPNEGWL